MEQALNPAERTRLGAHYTPRPYVERLVQATVMDPLRDDWDAVRAAAEDKQSSGDKAGAALELLAFHDQLTRTRVLDPACGTGNFLYVTLELMKALETEVLEARAGLFTMEEDEADLITADVKRGVDPRQFLGLELNPRAAAIAELVLWIGYLQASFRRDSSYRPRDPVLADYGTVNPMTSRRSENDRCVDAVLQSDGLVIGGGGASYPSARRTPWPEADFIVGNPPFIGGKFTREELGEAYAEALWRANPSMDHASDFVMYWWDRAADILTRRGSKLRRFGLVTTNSITQVFQRRTIARWLSAANSNKRSLSLIFAVDDHPWTKATKDAAAVRIAMTVARAGTHEGELARVTREIKLDTDQPEILLALIRGRINADLTVGADVTSAAPLMANNGVCSPGVKLHGAGFIVSRTQAEHLGLGRADRPELETHIRPYRNGRDLTGRPRGMMVIDLFGLTARQLMDRYPEVYQHISRSVRHDLDSHGVPKTDKKGRKTGRAWNNRESYKADWWVFGEPRQELRPALSGLARYIVTLATSKHRIFVFLDEEIMPDDALITICSPDAAHLAVLSSSLHGAWALAQGATLEDRPRYNKSRCFDPFPFPAWNETQRAGLADAGERLDTFRKARLAEHSQLTLTRLYNALEAYRVGRDMTPEEAGDFQHGSVLVLAELHAEIDALALASYGWPLDLAGEPLLAALVVLNAERAAEEARGEVRWLRPAYQAARFAKVKLAGPEHSADLLDDLPLAATERASWPKDARARVLALKGALAESSGPMTADGIAARFKGRGAAADVQRLIAVLERDGQVRRAPTGSYSLLRAA